YLTKLDLLLMSNVSKYTRVHALLHIKSAVWIINGCNQKYNVCTNAAFNGYIDILSYFRNLNFEWDHLTCAYAAENGHLETLKWARHNGCEFNAIRCLDLAKKFKYLNIQEWIINNRI